MGLPAVRQPPAVSDPSSCRAFLLHSAARRRRARVRAAAADAWRDSRCTSGSSPESSQDRRIPHCSKRTHGSALCRAALWSLLPSPCSALSSTQMVSNLLTPSTQDNNDITWHHKPRASRKSWDAGPPPAADTDAQGKSWDIRQPPADFDATYIRPPGLLSTSTKQDPQRWNYNNECG